jgi:hypothetical protein
MLNQVQKQIIRDTLKDWTVQVIRRNALPVVFVAMKDARTALVWKGGAYRNCQVKRYLEWIAAQIPDDNDFFEGVGGD